MMHTKEMTLANQVWVALARLTGRDSDHDGFTNAEIKAEVRELFGRIQPGIDPHLGGHCVANKEPHGGRTRMLYKIAHGRNRLFRPGDDYHADREGEPWKPERSQLPPRFHELLDWYETEYAPELKIFGPDAKLLKIKPGDSGLGDVAEHHDWYLNEAWLNRPTRIDRK